MSKREELERCLGDVYRELDKVKEQQQLLFPEGRLLFTTEVGKKMVPLIEREEELNRHRLRLWQGLVSSREK